MNIFIKFTERLDRYHLSLDPHRSRLNVYRTLHNSVGAGNADGAAILMRHWPSIYKQWKLSIADPGELSMFLLLMTGTIVYLSTDENQVIELREIDGFVEEVADMMNSADKFFHFRLAILLTNLGLLITILSRLNTFHFSSLLTHSTYIDILGNNAVHHAVTVAFLL